MSDKNFKTIRKQLRNVVQEIAPGIITQELVSTIQKSLSEDVQKRMDTIAAEAKETLRLIDERQKDLQNYLARILEQMTPPAPSDSAPPTDSL